MCVGTISTVGFLTITPPTSSLLPPLPHDLLPQEAIQKAVSDDKWLAVTMEANSLAPAYRQKSAEDFFHSTVLVLVGTEDGRFGVLDLTSGALMHAVQAHTTGAVQTITSLEEDSYIVTTGCGG